MFTAWVSACCCGLMRIQLVLLDLYANSRRVKGFPTIMAWVDGRLKDYAGDRSASSISDWALSLLPSRAVTVISKTAQVCSLFWDYCLLCLGVVLHE